MDWFFLANEHELASPSLIIHAERVEENLRQMLAIAGDASRLRPHVKTHKLPQLVARQMEFGIQKFKCATIAEAEMAASAGALDVLLAAQLVGPNIARFVQLLRQFPGTRFSSIIDAPEPLDSLAKALQAAGETATLLIDLDVGQHRTGIAPGPAAFALYQRLATLPGVRAGGLHAYDGHLHQSDPSVRKTACDDAFAPVEKLRTDLLAVGLPVPVVVAGGSPTFPIHANRPDVESSPGTCVLWDAGYGTNLPDLKFLPAVTLLTRVISKPATNRLCLDLGHKAVASEMQHPRVVFPQLPDARPVAHNEEHLVLETTMAGNIPVGTALHGIPWHVCPTVALHANAFVARNGRVEETWPVTARARCISI